MTLEQKIAQLHGAMETIDIYALSAQAAESGADMDQLVGLQKVFVEPGESKLVTITIDPAATNHPFSVWDYCTHNFVIKPGQYTVYVGNSADNTPHATTLIVA
jgi:beta-glucosidase